MKNFVSLQTLFVLFMWQNTVSQNNCLHFNGFNDIALNYHSSLDFSMNDRFTIELWFNTSSGTAVLFSNHIDVSPFKGYEVAVVNGKVVFDLTNHHLNNSLRIETVGSYNNGNWHHVACVYKGIPNAANAIVYIDGIQQSMVATHNSLSSEIITGNANHIGSRNNTAYFTIGLIDEIRIWNRDLCADEITARKNCHLLGSEYGLLAYYTFNQGIAGGNNSLETSLTDFSGNNISGTLSNFNLTGSTSNWVGSTTGVTGTCQPYSLSMIFSGNSLICQGTSHTISVAGATGYTWQPGNMVGSLVTVTPLTTTAYTVSGFNSNNCFGTSVYTHSVVAPAPLGISGKTLMCHGDSNTLTVSGGSGYTWQPGKLAGATVVVKPNTSTDYTVTGIDMNGCATNSVFKLTVELCTSPGRVIMNEKENLKFYPNPSGGVFHLSGVSCGEFIEVYNLFGGLVQKFQAKDTEILIDLSTENKGVYIVRISHQSYTCSTMIVKE